MPGGERTGMPGIYTGQKRWVARIMGLGIGAFIFWLCALPVDLSVIRSLRLGDEVIVNGRVPEEDLRISAPLDSGWVHQGWLLDAALASLFRAYGPKGLIVAKAGTVALAFVILFSVLGRMGRSLASRTFLVMGSFWLSHIAQFPWEAAADLFLTAVLVYLLVPAPGEKWCRWLLVPLMALWANVHWGFVLGLILCCAWLVSDFSETRHGGRGRWPLVVLISGIFLACCATPRPLAVFGALPKASADWVAPHFHLAAPRWTLVVFFGILTLALLSRRQFGRGVTFAWMASFVGAVSNTNWIPLFGWMSSTAMGASLGSWGGGPGSEGRVHCGSRLPWARAQGAVAWLAALAMAVSLAWAGRGQRQWAFRSEVFPRAAMAAIKAHGPGQRVLNDVRYGDALLAAVYPSSRPFLVNEFGSASPDVYRDYLRLLPPPNLNWARRAGDGAHHYYPPKGVNRNWREVLDRYGFEWALVSPDSQLGQILRHCPGWRLEVAEEGCLLFRRETGATETPQAQQAAPAIDPEVSKARGMQALAIGNPFRALWYFRGPASQGDPVALLGAARALVAMGRREQALQALKTAREADPEGKMAVEIGALEDQILGADYSAGKGP